jgi:triosephosphate isomerase
MRKPLVAGNWKMNTSAASATDLAKTLVTTLGQQTAVEVAVCPPFPYLLVVRDVLKGSKIALGAQNTHPDTKGAFTGETSPVMLTDCGCTWVIVGHSERRHLLGEGDEFIRRKLIGALAVDLHVILCVGETMAQRQNGSTETVIEKQLSGTLQGLSGEQLKNVVIAYEPVWAIGTGLTASPEQAEEVHVFIRHWFATHISQPLSQVMRILYGGSVNASNAAALMAKPNVDGLLVGGASLKADEFSAIVQAAAAAPAKP